MKKLLFIALGLGISAGAFSQTEHPVKKEEMKDLRTDVRAHKVATHRVNHDLAHARVSKAVRDHKTVHQINRNESAHARALKARGVDHPVAKAKRQVKVQDDNRKDHTN